MDWDLILGVGRFVLATTLLLLLTIPTAFIVIQMELKVIALMQLRYGPNRVGSEGDVPEHDPRLQGARQGGLSRRTMVDRPTFTLAPWMVFMAAAMSMLVIPFAPGAGRLRLEHQRRLLLRDPGPVGGGPARRRLGQLQQVLAAGRPAQRGPDGVATRSR